MFLKNEKHLITTPPIQGPWKCFWNCYKNGDMTGKSESAIAYAWYVWEKGFTGDPVIKWFN